MQDVEKTIGSQFANSPILLALIDNFNTYVDPSQNIDNFLSLVWDVSTAVGYGLDVWGRIVGVSRVLQIATGTYFGFTGPHGTSGDSFGAAPFYSGGSLTSNYALTDTAFRTLIYAKAAANICNGAIPSINALLVLLFPARGNCYVTDGLNMTMTYSFHFALSPAEYSILSQSGVLPTPSGVSATIVQGLP